MAKILLEVLLRLVDFLLLVIFLKLQVWFCLLLFILQQGDVDDIPDDEEDDDGKDDVFGITSVINLTEKKVSNKKSQ